MKHKHTHFKLPVQKKGVQFICFRIKRWITIRNHLKYHVTASKRSFVLYYIEGDLKDCLFFLAVERNWICDLCGARFKSNNQLTSHARMVHSDERPYKCPTCGLGYALVASETDFYRVRRYIIIALAFGYFSDSNSRAY